MSADGDFIREYQGLLEYLRDLALDTDTDAFSTIADRLIAAGKLLKISDQQRNEWLYGHSPSKAAQDIRNEEEDRLRGIIYGSTSAAQCSHPGVYDFRQPDDALIFCDYCSTNVRNGGNR